VIPISYYETPSPFRERMHDYKESPDPSTRYAESRIVGGILARYLDEFGDSLADRFGEWDAVVPVPSTKNPPPSALTQALAADFSDFVDPLEWLTRGTGQMKFTVASESGFVPTTNVEGASVLLIDDTYTTGARLHSAAHALQAAGAKLVAGVVVARKINPIAKYYAVDLWQRQSAISFSFTDPPWWSLSRE
jgi:glutamine phosphoribosylpyrophosphate amidotransferase